MFMVLCTGKRACVGVYQAQGFSTGAVEKLVRAAASLFIPEENLLLSSFM